MAFASFDDIPLWLKQGFLDLGNDVAAWAGVKDHAQALLDMPTYFEAAWTVAMADTAAWYTAGSSTGSAGNLPSFFLQLAVNMGNDWAGTTYLHDQATGVAATMNGRSPDNVGAGTWATSGTSTGVLSTDGSGAFEMTAGTSGSRMAVYDVGVDTCTFTVDITMNVASGVIFRYADTINHFDAYMSNTTLFLRERTSGTATTRDSTAHTYTNSVTYTMTITLTGTTISVECDGATVSYASASKAANTHLGLRPQTNTVGTKWDNVKVVS